MSEHAHVWTQRQNATTKGYVVPAYEVCWCGAARSPDQPGERGVRIAPADYTEFDPSAYEPDPPAEDAREARLSEDAERIVAKLEDAGVPLDQGREWVADMLTQREREVVASLRVAMLQRGHHRNDLGDGEWWVTDSYIAGCLDRALGGTADGEGE